MPKEKKCQFCETTIRFVENQNGNKTPIEVEALTTADFKHGEMMVLEDGRMVKNSADWVDYTGDVYRPHFAACPGADQARRPR